jgi:hypothetical protein
MSITPNANQIAGAYYAVSLTNGTQYSFSADILDVAGQSYSLWFADNAGNLVGAATTWTGNGHWKRRSVTYTAAATATHRLYLTRASINSTAVYYTDGWQLETGSVSTYLDGDMRGFVRTQTDYYWTGTPHVSTSYRSGQTKSGGTEVRLKDYMRIIAVLGLGLAPIVNSALPNVRGGAFFQSSKFDSRTITLSGKVVGLAPDVIYDNRKALVAAINPRNVGADQPMVLRISALDTAGGVEQAEPVDAVVQYSGGLEGDFDRPGAEDVPLQFRMFLPYLVADGEKGAGITINQTIADSDFAMKRDKTGAWSAISGQINDTVRAFAKGNDGSIYVGGAFTDVGDANGDYIFKISPAGVISSLGTGMAGGIVTALAVSPSGDVYAGGAFTSAGGVANTARIARWDGAAWNSVGGGIASGAVLALAFSTSGNLYIGGSFTNHFDANGDYITVWSGSAYSSLGTGMNGNVLTLSSGGPGIMYAAGDFTLAGGVANTVRVAKWTSAGAWEPLSTGANVVVRSSVYSNGSLYIGGDFTTVGGLSISYCARWNGAAWDALDTLTDPVYSMAADSNGNIYVGSGNPYTQGLPVVFWNGYSFANLDVVVPRDIVLTIIYAIFIDRDQVYIGYDDDGSATAPLIASVTNTGSAPAAPKITFTGPGIVYQVKNTTSGKSVFFDLTLLAGETAVLDLNPDNPTFTSTFRGNLLSTILAGSNMDLSLLPGANNLSIFIAGTTTAATTVTVTYREQYASLDGTRY